MKRVDIGSATLYLADAAEVIPTLGTVDLIATDPPWSVAFQSGRRTASPKFDVIHGDRGEVDVAAILNAAVRKLQPYRHLYVFGPRTLIAQVKGISEPIDLVWDKELLGMGDLALPWGPGHEPISFAVKVPSPANVKKGYGKGAARMRQSSVLHGMRPNAKMVTKHPNEKPVDVMRRLIEASSNIGDTIFDPFMGSASTVVAALVSGRRAIGIEIDETYFSAAIDRVRRILPTLQQLESA